jgi:hypothetical protein
MTWQEKAVEMFFKVTSISAQRAGGNHEEFGIPDSRSRCILGYSLMQP